MERVDGCLELAHLLHSGNGRIVLGKRQLALDVTECVYGDSMKPPPTPSVPARGSVPEPSNETLERSDWKQKKGNDWI